MIIDDKQKSKPTNTRICKPATDIVSCEDGIKIFIDLPGADENSTDISVENNILTVKAAYIDSFPQSFKTLHREFEECDYQREFTLPKNVSSDKISASLNDGVLEMFLPFSEEVKPKKIEIKKK
ncbi:Hsp20/alpha crystallin family protein [candidate division WOR-3 bacterium]|nr:Hsp20/alpha crystallin family protein [candidate division WOR-3 bacterium]